MKLTITKDRRDHVFDSLAEAIEIAGGPVALGEKVSDAHRIGVGGTRADECYGTDWFGTKTFGEALTLARQGWPAGREKAAALSASLVNHIVGERSQRPRLTLAPAGFAPCVPAAVSGAHESMFDTRKEIRFGTGRVVSIVFNGGALAEITAEAMMMRGAVCMALVDLLENAGFRCEIFRTSYASCGAGIGSWVIPLKRPEDALDMDALAFWLIHPGAHRRMVFAMREILDFPFYHRTGGDYRTEETPEGEQGDIYMSGATLRQIRTNENAAQFLKDQLAKQGVEFDS